MTVKITYEPEAITLVALVDPGRQVLTAQLPSGMAFRARTLKLDGELEWLLVEDVHVGKWKQFTRESHPILDLFMGPPKPQLVEASVFGVDQDIYFNFDTALPAMNLSLILHNRNCDGPVSVRVRYLGESLKV